MLGRPVTATNDAQAAAWGEHRFGAGRGRDMVFVTISTGVGDETELVAPNAKKSGIGVTQAPSIISAGSMEYKYASGGMPAQVEVTRENPGEATGGRMSWSQLR